MEIRTETVNLTTPDGKMPAYLCHPAGAGPHPAIIVVMEACLGEDPGVVPEVFEIIG